MTHDLTDEQKALVEEARKKMEETLLSDTETYSPEFVEKCMSEMGVSLKNKTSETTQ